MHPVELVVARLVQDLTMGRGPEHLLIDPKVPVEREEVLGPEFPKVCQEGHEGGNRADKPNPFKKLRTVRAVGSQLLCRATAVVGHGRGRGAGPWARPASPRPLIPDQIQRAPDGGTQWQWTTSAQKVNYQFGGLRG